MLRPQHAMKDCSYREANTRTYASVHDDEKRQLSDDDPGTISRYQQHTISLLIQSIGRLVDHAPWAVSGSAVTTDDDVQEKKDVGINSI